MSDGSPGAKMGDLPLSDNGVLPAPRGPRYCAHCGHEITGRTPVDERFGESFCSEDHAVEFAAGVRTIRTEAVAGAAIARSDGGAGASPAPAARTGRWKMALKMAACCGLPVLALVVLAGGGGALLGAAGAALPLLAALACPVGMFLMMRAMSRGRGGDERSTRGSGEP